MTPLSRAFALTLAAAALATPADAHYGGAVSTTSYCLRGLMADGTKTRPRSAASNTLRLGTRIRIVGRHGGPGGLRRYVVRDRIGHGTELDLWTESCAAAVAFGRHGLRFKIGWRR